LVRLKEKLELLDSRFR